MVEESDKHAHYANEQSDEFRNCDRSLGSRTKTSQFIVIILPKHGGSCCAIDKGISIMYLADAYPCCF